MILVVEDIYGPPLSISTKKYNSPLFYVDVLMMSESLKNGSLQIFAENVLIFKLSPKIKVLCYFYGFFTNYEREWLS